MIIDNILKNNPMLIKNGAELPISIISSGIFDGTQTMKNIVKKTIGDVDSFEFIGVGDRKVTIPLFFNTQDEYDNFFNFVKDGQAFLISCNFFPLVPVNIEGDISLKPYFKGCGTVELKLTTAISPYQDTVALLNYVPTITQDLAGSKKTVLDKLLGYGQKTFDFVSNTNQKIGVITNTVAAFAAAINNQAQGIAAISTIITNPISSIKNSISQIIGGVSGIVDAITNAINTINQIPSDTRQLIDSLSAVGDELNNLYDLGDSNETLKYNMLLLSGIGVALVDVDLSQDNEVISTYNSPYQDAEYFLTTIKNDNEDCAHVIILTSILINLYDNAGNINKWNSIDLDNLRIKTEKIYLFIVSFNIDIELKIALDIARNSFFRLFRVLYERSVKVISVELPEVVFLTDVVYSVNGNFDYLEETKKINNVIGTKVSGTILVVKND